MNKPNPFQYLDAITWTKDSSWADSDNEQYIPFILNRHFSQFADTVMYANDLNQRHDVMSKNMQFQYFLSSLPKRKRFGKWKKKTENADVDLLSKALHINKNKAEELLPLVSKEQLEKLRQHYEPATGSRPRNVRRSKTKPS